jgi:hypothetical protein
MPIQSSIATVSVGLKAEFCVADISSSLLLGTLLHSEHPPLQEI